MNKYKKEDVVVFNIVTKKYGCRFGIIKDSIKLYTDHSLKYKNLQKNHPNRNDVNYYTDVGVDRTRVDGYVINALNSLGVYVETIVVTEGFISGCRSVES